MKLKQIFAFSAASLVLAACGATGTAFSGLEAPAEGQSKLYVYRTKALKGGGVHFDVNANDTRIGHLRNGGYISTELPPGNYEVWAKTEVHRGVTVPLQANEIQCVKASVGFGAFVGRPKFQHVPLEQCKAEIAGTVRSF